MSREHLLALTLTSLLLGCGSDTDYTPTGATPEPLTTGLQTVWSGGVPREYYIQIPPDAAVAAVSAAAVEDGPPLVIAFHGYTGAYTNWVGPERFYDLIDVVGDEAVFVAPNGLRDSAGKRVWGGTADLNFFADLLADLDRRGLRYDPERIFVAGHSNGAGFAHELGCAYGDVIRAIAVAAGGLTRTDCTGAMAVLMFQGSNDPLTSINIARGARRYWVLYNGWDENAFVPALEFCDSYAFPDKPDNLPYPVVWCQHTQGHDWPTFASATAWEFLTALPAAQPGPNAPPGGGAERATPPSDANLTFQVNVPAAINRPLSAAASLRPLSYIDNPTCSAPDVILNSRFPVDGRLIPGQVSEPITIPITYFSFLGGVQFPSEWAFSLTIYVEGGSNTTIPAAGIDYDVAIPVSLIARESDVVIPEVLELEPVIDVCGFGS